MWEQIRANRIRSAILVAAMAGLLLGLGYIFGIALFGSAIAGLVIALILWVIMNLVAFFQGDSILLSVAGAHKIDREDHPRLYNVVEEMKIASALPAMPQIYIIDDPALNAFATGRSPEKASVAITSGLLQKLNRDELQGVIAHEISHVKNRDTMLMMLTSVMLGTIVILSWYASRMIFLTGGRSSGRRGGQGGGNGQIIIIAVGLLLAILAPIFAQLIYFAVSRQREYLADASAALYTRYPEGLASSLVKLATSPTEVKAANKATAPLYIVNPFRPKGWSASDLTSTHPPLAERIRILRSMAGGASLSDYNKAYQQVRGGSVVPGSALAGASALAARGPQQEEKEPAPAERARAASEALWKQSDHRLVECECGTRLRIPPEFTGNAIRCPHCGRVHVLAGSGSEE